MTYLSCESGCGMKRDPLLLRKGDNSSLWQLSVSVRDFTHCLSPNDF